jgi:purine nucleoside phosphorylase
MKAIIGGTSLLNSSLFRGWDERSIQTPFGEIQVRQSGTFVFLQRHGRKRLPPHAINHQANIWGLKTIGAETAVAVNSVGSMKIALKPRSFVVPHDFIAPWIIPTFFNTEMRFTIPSIDAGLSARLHSLCEQLEVPVTGKGVYLQTLGPRFETRAEIGLFRKHADIVGMTMASEATLCTECEIPYASLCSVDNYANGIARRALTIEEVEGNIKSNMDMIEMLLRELLSAGF